MSGLSPNSLTKQWNLAFGRGFVNISAIFSSVGTYLMEIFSFSTASQMKWYWISICLVWAWNLLSFDNTIAPWLSHFNVTSLSNLLISPINVLPPLQHVSVQCTPLQYLTMWWCIVFSSSKWWHWCQCGRNIPRLSACVAVQPNPCHRSLQGSFFLAHQTSARGLWWFLGKWLASSLLPSVPDPGFAQIETEFQPWTLHLAWKSPLAIECYQCTYGMSHIQNCWLGVEGLWSLLKHVSGSIGIMTGFELVSQKFSTILSM